MGKVEKVSKRSVVPLTTPHLQGPSEWDEASEPGREMRGIEWYCEIIRLQNLSLLID